MALIYMSKDRRYAFLPEPVVAAAPDLSVLISYAREAGLHLRAYEVDDSAELLHNAEFPLLLLLKEGDGTHMVFLLAHKRHHFLLLDPSRGKRKIEEGEMVSLWTGVFLRIEGYEEKNEGQISFLPRLHFPRFFPVLTILALLPMAFMVSGLLIINLLPSTSFSLIPFLASLASSMVLKACMLGAMDRFDAMYMDGTDAKFLKRRRDLYVHYQAYKRAAFVHKTEVLGRLGTLLAALTFLLFQDLVLALAASIVIIVTCLAHLFLDPKETKVQEACEKLESRYFYATVEEPRRKEMRGKLREYSRRYTRIRNLSASIASGCAVLLAFLFTFLSGNFSAGSILFYLLGLLFIAGEGDGLYRSHALLELKKKEEPYFILNIASNVDAAKNKERK